MDGIVLDVNVYVVRFYDDLYIWVAYFESSTSPFFV